MIISGYQRPGNLGAYLLAFSAAIDCFFRQIAAVIRCELQGANASKMENQASPAVCTELHKTTYELNVLCIARTCPECVWRRFL